MTQKKKLKLTLDIVEATTNSRDCIADALPAILEELPPIYADDLKRKVARAIHDLPIDAVRILHNKLIEEENYDV